VKALTVQQPWAWAIVHGGKDVENRTQAWSYRGPLAIHAGARVSDRGLESPLITQAFGDVMRADRPHELRVSALLGVVDLVDVHEARMLDDESGCCDPWGEQEWHGRRHLVHLVLANPRPLERPIPCAGKLGLWTPPAEILDELREAL
jgi:hypothetical protein